MHGFVVTSLAFVIAKNTSTTKGRQPATPKPLQEALLSISADKSCCATRAVYNTGMVTFCARDVLYIHGLRHPS